MPIPIVKRTAAPRPRPRFDIFVPSAPDDVFQRLHNAIQESSAVRGVALDRFRFEMILDDKSFRVWAPQLDVKLVPEGESTKVMGRFGPHPHIWMAYLSIYMSSGFLAVACAVWGGVQWSLDKSAWVLYVSPLAFVFAGLAYGASYVGQGLATGQMYQLREFLEDAITASESPAKPENPGPAESLET